MTTKQMDAVDAMRVRPCFAYNQQRQRCDMPGGHPGDHSITATWTDDECYDPNGTIEVTLTTYGHPIMVPDQLREDLVEVEMDQPCESCLHEKDMHSGGVGECAGCDCRGYIG